MALLDAMAGCWGVLVGAQEIVRCCVVVRRVVTITQAGGDNVRKDHAYCAVREACSLGTFLTPRLTITRETVGASRSGVDRNPARPARCTAQEGPPAPSEACPLQRWALDSN